MKLVDHSRGLLAWRLPRVGDRAIRWVTPLWLTILTMAILGLGVGQLHVYDRLAQALPAFADFGLRFGVNDSPLKLGEPLDEATRRAGIADGDSVLAVDGRQVPSDATPQDVAKLLRQAGPSVTLRTRSEDGRISDHRLLRANHEKEVYRGTGLDLQKHELGLLAYDTFTGLVLIGVGVLLFIRRARDPVATLLSMAFLLLIASYSWTWLLDVAHAPWLVAVLRPTAWCLMEALLFLFPTGRFMSRWSAFACCGVAVQWLLWVAGAPYVAVGLLAALGLVGGLLSIAERLRRSDDATERQQVKWTLFGFSAGFLFLLVAIVNKFVAPLFTHNTVVLVLADSFQRAALVTMIACISVGMLASLLRVRVYDADIFISRSATLALLTVMIGALGVGGERALERIIEGNFGEGYDAEATFIAATIAAMAIVPIHQQLHHWAERQFQKGLALLRHDLPAFLTESLQHAELDDLLGGVLQRIEAGAHASRGAILLEDGETIRPAAVRDCAETEVVAWLLSDVRLDAAVVVDHDDPLFPVRCRIPDEQGRAMGWILLGPRPDGTLVGGEERRTLCSIASTLGRAVALVRLREARWDGMRAHVLRLNDRIDELATRLTEIAQSAKAAAGVASA